MAVVFDIGSVARDNEHVHAVALGQVQKRLGYCSTEPLVADFELKLERDSHWPMFLEKAQKTWASRGSRSRISSSLRSSSRW